VFIPVTKQLQKLLKLLKLQQKQPLQHPLQQKQPLKHHNFITQSHRLLQKLQHLLQKLLQFLQELLKLLQTLLQLLQKLLQLLQEVLQLLQTLSQMQANTYPPDATTANLIPGLATRSGASMPTVPDIHMSQLLMQYTRHLRRLKSKPDNKLNMAPCFKAKSAAFSSR
jgi:hypothetical protein